MSPAAVDPDGMTASASLPSRFATERLVARLPVAGDAEAIHASYASDPRVTRFLLWTAHADVATTRAFVEGCIAEAARGARLPYVLVERASGEVVGMLEARPRGHTVDLGYVLAARAWGRGLMPEAVAALSTLALALPHVFRVQAFCDVENVASRRVLEKAGLAFEGTLARYAVHPNLGPEPRACRMFARTKPEPAIPG